MPAKKQKDEDIVHAIIARYKPGLSKGVLRFYLRKYLDGKIGTCQDIDKQTLRVNFTKGVKPEAFEKLRQKMSEYGELEECSPE